MASELAIFHLKVEHLSTMGTESRVIRSFPGLRRHTLYVLPPPARSAGSQGRKKGSTRKPPYVGFDFPLARKVKGHPDGTRRHKQQNYSLSHSSGGSTEGPESFFIHVFELQWGWEGRWHSSHSSCTHSFIPHTFSAPVFWAKSLPSSGWQSARETAAQSWGLNDVCSVSRALIKCSGAQGRDSKIPWVEGHRGRLMQEGIGDIHLCLLGTCCM